MSKETVFADNFKKFRKLRGISQKEFARRLFELTGRKLTLTSISNYETGMHMPPPQVLPFIANILEVSIDALFGTADPAIEEEAEVQKEEVQEANSLDKWKQELRELEKEFYHIKIHQAKTMPEEVKVVLEWGEKLLSVAKKQQDELLILQTELATIREVLSLLRG